MKIVGKKIPRGNLLLFLSFTAISLCLLLIVSAIRAEHRNSQSQNGLYSGHQKGFSVHNSEDEDQWTEVIPELASRHGNFAIYLPVQDPEIVMRGICVQGEVETPTMLEGKYFDLSTSWTDHPTLVVGKQYQEDVVRRAGKMYYKYGDVEYEVIGIMGEEEESRINQMILMDFRSALWITGINAEYILDTQKEAALTELGQDMYDLFHSPAEVLIILEGDVKLSVIARLLSGGAVMSTLYIMTLISFSLSTVLVTFIWLRFRRQLFFAYALCGYGRRLERLEISKKFYLVSGTGFVAGLLLMIFISRFMTDIYITVSDLLIALGITVGLGTVILFLCYGINRYKAALL